MGIFSRDYKYCATCCHAFVAELLHIHIRVVLYIHSFTYRHVEHVTSCKWNILSGTAVRGEDGIAGEERLAGE